MRRLDKKSQRFMLPSYEDKWEMYKNKIDCALYEICILDGKHVGDLCCVAIKGLNMYMKKNDDTAFLSASFILSSWL